MHIDYRILDGRRPGLTFHFMPALDRCAESSVFRYDGPDVFNVREEAFLFIEGMVAQAYPEWRNYGRWGVTWLPRETWLDILSRFPQLRHDVRGNAHLNAIVRNYVFAPGLIPTHKFHRKALLLFLDEFEERVRMILERYPYLVIGGI